MADGTQPVGSNKCLGEHIRAVADHKPPVWQSLDELLNCATIKGCYVGATPRPRYRDMYEPAHVVNDTNDIDSKKSGNVRRSNYVHDPSPWIEVPECALAIHLWRQRTL
eukprot:GHVU01199044.1.p2 GENE.GHVU01199044.1~~GHVU01199044.1.p2  ORF type:complete len:109 (+),score=2.12 GHVU01199044.1:423-749(+)